MSGDLWNERPSRKAFLKLGSCMKGMQYDNWICFSMVYTAGNSLRLDFRDLQYAFLQEKYVGLAEEHYPGIKCLL